MQGWQGVGVPLEPEAERKEGKTMGPGGDYSDGH